MLAIARKGRKQMLYRMRRRHIKTGRKFYSISTVLYRRGELGDAIRFRSIAAQLGYARAMYVMGCHYEFGDGVDEDRVKANAWYARAMAAGLDMVRIDLKGSYLRERKRLSRA